MPGIPGSIPVADKSVWRVQAVQPCGDALLVPEVSYKPCDNLKSFLVSRKRGESPGARRDTAAVRLLGPLLSSVNSLRVLQICILTAPVLQNFKGLLSELRSHELEK